MKRGTTTVRAVRSAFARSVPRPGIVEPMPVVARTRLHPWALAFVVGFPLTIGALVIGFNVNRQFDLTGIIVLGVLPTIGALLLLVLGLRSEARVNANEVSVRFLGIRTTTVRFDDLRGVTFEMAFPSISFALVLKDVTGRTVRIHANWWRDERIVVRPICRRVLELGVPLDRSAARVVAEVLGVKRPKATIVHHALFNKNRTW
jgi:hypothetical protein